LGIERGMTVITKIDAVDEDLLEMVQADVEEYLAGTFLAAAPTMLVSNITGQGIDELREALIAALQNLPERDRSGVFRMPVQRSFSIRGHGTVVTGVPVSGFVRVGDELEVLPRGHKVRVRGLQVHHAAASEACAGHRAALNITDVNYRDVHRGDVVAARGYFGTADLLEARLEYLIHHETPLRNDVPIRLHVGTTDVCGRVVLLDRPHLLPGESGLVQLRLDEKIVVAARDRFVLRLESPVVTLGGGTILGETKWRFKRFRDWLVDNIEHKEAHLGDHRRYLEYVIRSQGKRLVALPELALNAKQRPEDLKDDIAGLIAENRLVHVDSERSWIHMDMFKAVGKDLSDALLRLHEADRLQPGFPASRIARESKIDLPLVEAALAEWTQRGKLELLSQKRYRHRDWTGGLSKEDYRLVTAIEGLHRKSLFGSPIRSEIRDTIGKPEKKTRELLDYLFAMGTLISLTPDLAVHREAVEVAELRLCRRILDGGPMPSKEFKDIIEASRKYVIPLLEYFDAKGVTIRSDSERSLSEAWRDAVFPVTLDSLGG
ncbi:MAG: SelB C-terminal domain-containing protein, partial [Planctomycetes bacterium]|nr:SelB C-terminal domain-containing protein [Planctomycetota bacterium]